MKVELVRTFYLEAAHRNPRGDERQRRVHGHSYRVEVLVEGEVESPFGWLVDYADIKGAFEPIRAQLDHAYLNEVDGLEDATLPRLRAWILQRLQPHLAAWLKKVRVTIVGDCAFRPVELPPDPLRNLPGRWRFTFEAAQALPQLPQSHQCHRLHGHSYRIEAGARDLARLRPGLEGLYNVLDHQCLNDVDGLEGATCEHLCRWLWQRLAGEGHELTVVAVQETESARCIYYGE